MCHDHIPNEWYREGKEETEEVDENPSLSEAEPVDDVEILTDGGDE